MDYNFAAIAAMAICTSMNFFGFYSWWTNCGPGNGLVVSQHIDFGYLP